MPTITSDTNPTTAGADGLAATGPRAGIGPRLAAFALIGGALLNTTEAVLAQFLPERPEGTADQLRAVAEHATLYGVRAVIGTLAIPLMAVAFVAVSQLLATRARRVAGVAKVALLAGMWGFLGIHVFGLLQLPASALDDPEGAARVLDAGQAHPVLAVLFLLPFLAGCTLGMVLLGAGILKTRVLPRWIGAAWLVFILVDFTVGAVGPIDPHWLFLAGSVGAAVAVLRSSRRAAATAD